MMRIPVSAVADIRDYLRHRSENRTVSLTPISQLYNPELGFARLVAANNPSLLPVAGPKVAAIFPSPADDYIEDHLSLDELLISEKESSYLVRVKGTSMINIGIFPGDLMIVDRSRDAKSGDVVIAVLDGEITVKRLELKNNRTALKPENSKFPPIYLREGQELHIWGIVTYSIRKHLQ